MSVFEINDQLQSTFLINKSKINGRLDPNFNYFNRIVQHKLNSSKYPVKRLMDGISFIQYGTSSLASREEVGCPVIRMNNIQDETLDFTDIKYISLTDKEVNNYRLNKGDLLFNRTNSKELVGKCAVFLEEGTWVYASYIIRVQLNESYLLPQYVSTFLNSPIGRLQINSISRQIAGMTNINAEEIKELKIPVPPLEIQKSIVEYIGEARRIKTQKEVQAADQIAHVDNYLLTELGISVLDSDGALENRIFKVNFSETSGKRFDPLFFYQNFLDQVAGGRYPVELLNRHVAYLQSGFAAGKGDQSMNNEDIIQIRPTNFSNTRELVFDRNVYIPRETIMKSTNDILQSSEILFNNTNSQELVGKSVLFDLDGTYCCSNHITRIGTASSLDSGFLEHLLNLYQRQKVFFRICTNWNNQSGVNNDVLGGLPIPIPPVEKQRSIANTITALRNSAKQLRQEAKNELEIAQQTIERIILNE